MEIEKLEIEDIDFLYHNFLVTDFPANELKSLDTIKTSFRMGRTACFVMKHKNNIMAYGILVWSRKVEVASS